MTDLWAGDFGDQYTKRNASGPDRAGFWRAIMPRHVESVLEVGANIGKNLEAISTFSNAELYAVEPNAMAREDLTAIMPASKITGDYADKISWPDGIADLAITCGLLIHIPASKLTQSMREIHRVSRRWIISAEYFAPSEEMVPYRGHADALWRRDYGSLWLDTFPDLKCTTCMFAWKRLTGMDNLTVWVMEKGNRRH